MSDFEVTDHYEFAKSDDGIYRLTLQNGTTLYASVTRAGGELTRYAFVARTHQGEEISLAEGEAVNDFLLEVALQKLARDVINKEEPLRSEVNWANQDLVMLLLEQGRIVLCPVCMGNEQSTCRACAGSSWIAIEDLSKFVDFDDDRD